MSMNWVFFFPFHVVIRSEAQIYICEQTSYILKYLSKTRPCWLCALQTFKLQTFSSVNSLITFSKDLVKQGTGSAPERATNHQFVSELAVQRMLEMLSTKEIALKEQ